MRYQRLKVTQQDQARPRFIYVLGFADGSCYVGQTVRPKMRHAEHQDLWKRPFTMTVVDRIQGTYKDAEDLEFAWRYIAQQQGHPVYGQPGVLVQPSRRMDDRRLAMARQVKWRKLKTPATTAPWGTGKWVATIAGLLALATVLPAVVQGIMRLFGQ